MTTDNRQVFLKRALPLKYLIDEVCKDPQGAFDSAHSLEVWEEAVSIMEQVTGPEAWQADEYFVQWVINRLPDLIHYRDPANAGERLMLSLCRQPRPNPLRYLAMSKAIAVALNTQNYQEEFLYALGMVSSILAKSANHADYWNVVNMQKFCRILLDIVAASPFPESNWVLAKRAIKLICAAEDLTMFNYLRRLKDKLPNSAQHFAIADDFTYAQNIAFLDTGIRRLTGKFHEFHYEGFTTDINGFLKKNLGDTQMLVYKPRERVKCGDTIQLGIKFTSEDPTVREQAKQKLEHLTVRCQGWGFWDIKTVQGRDLTPRDAGPFTWSPLDDELRCTFELTANCPGDQQVLLTISNPFAERNDKREYSAILTVTVD